MERDALIKTLTEVQNALEKRVCVSQKACHDCPLLLNSDCTIASLITLIAYLEKRA